MKLDQKRWLPPVSLYLKSILIIMFSWYMIAGLIFPITQDEAYYALWSNTLSWGYFDHPPAVALLNFFWNGFNTSLINGRFLTAICATATIFICGLLYELIGLKKEQWLIAMALLCSSFGMLALGILTTPDTLQTLAWAIGLHESAYALRKDQRRWVTAGFATGIGLLSKYTTVLIGPVFLIGILAGNKNQLKTFWPYLGGLICLAVFSPHLIWNSHNNWTSFRFQTHHGLSTAHSNYLSGDEMLPSSLPNSENSIEYNLAKPFIESEFKPSSQAITKSEWVVTLQRVSNYLASQLGFWGCHFILFLLLALAWIKRKPIFNSSVDRHLKPLIIAGALWPILFFTVIALRGKVEANWSAMYIIAGAPLLGCFKLKWRYVFIASCLNVFLVSLLIIHARFPFLPIKSSNDRLLKETHGYISLAAWGHTSDIPIYADSYQLVSMLRWYGLFSIHQWPGITRPSHFVFSKEERSQALKSLQNQNSFYLITTNTVPPKIPDFVPVDMFRWLDCVESTLITHLNQANDPSGCDFIHKWYVVTYVKKNHS